MYRDVSVSSIMAKYADIDMILMISMHLKSLGYFEHEPEKMMLKIL